MTSKSAPAPASTILSSNFDNNFDNTSDINNTLLDQAPPPYHLGSTSTTQCRSIDSKMANDTSTNGNVNNSSPLNSPANPVEGHTRAKVQYSSDGAIIGLALGVLLDNNRRMIQIVFWLLVIGAVLYFGKLIWFEYVDHASK